ncbi:beta-xylosidase [Mucilaginibacter pedocola]|uniref:Beta-xylosidase n=2 Tax=Mucilaginibacter pedocola TaxID=1792845 RepID=A0A1S9PG22_9SPHI|nr:beta-xylosidase [Mucilaginibacter pedocola]
MQNTRLPKNTIIVAALLCFVASYFPLKASALPKPVGDTILLADPTIFADKGMYYLYGTGGRNGFMVYQSADLKTWTGPIGKRDGYALTKGDSYGTQGFWAPQIFKQGGKYYMAYTANEHIAIAESDSPLGPFTQKELKPISGPGKQIDPFIFKDTNGDLYMYHVRLQKGNRIFMARLKANLSDIDTTTTKECLHAELPWENTAKTDWPVSEGPTVLKHGKLYYLLYSVNDFRNIDYAVGYATSASPMGPWKKAEDGPIISRQNTGANGTGHGDVFTGPDGKLYYVLHTHHSNTKVGERKTAVIAIKFDKSKPAKIVVDKSTFRYLEAQK